MKIRTTKDSVSIGANWLLVICCVLIAIFAWYHVSEGTVSSTLFFPGYPVIGICAVAAAAYSTQAFRIDAKGIWISYLGISFRHIYWNEVRGIVLAPFRKGNQKDSIVIMLKDAPPFTDRDCASDYARKNTSRCYCVIIPEDRAEEIVSIINGLIWEHIEPISVT